MDSSKVQFQVPDSLVGGWTNLSEKYESNWIISPSRDGKKQIFKTTGLVDRTVLVPWLIGNVKTTTQCLKVW